MIVKRLFLFAGLMAVLSYHRSKAGQDIEKHLLLINRKQAAQEQAFIKQHYVRVKRAFHCTFKKDGQTPCSAIFFAEIGIQNHVRTHGAFWPYSCSCGQSVATRTGHTTHRIAALKRADQYTPKQNKDKRQHREKEANPNKRPPLEIKARQNTSAPIPGMKGSDPFFGLPTPYVD